MDDEAATRLDRAAAHYPGVGGGRAGSDLELRHQLAHRHRGMRAVDDQPERTVLVVNAHRDDRPVETIVADAGHRQEILAGEKTRITHPERHKPGRWTRAMRVAIAGPKPMGDYA
jgi:hypothetical protein